MNSIKDQKMLTDRELIIFNSELDRKRKSTAIAYIFYFFLGSIGGHKFYIGKPIMGSLYIFLSFVSILLFSIGGAATISDPSVTTDSTSTVFVTGFLSLALWGLFMLIDLFTIPGQIKKQEERVRNDLLMQLVSNN